MDTRRRRIGSWALFLLITCGSVHPVAGGEGAWKAQIDRADGLVTDGSVLVQTLPLKQAEEVAEALQKEGYRPTRLRPYRHGDQVRLAGLWTRNTAEARAEFGLTAEQVRRREEVLRKDGMAAADVAGYLDGAGERYAVVWARQPAGVVTRLYVGVPDGEHDAVWQGLRRDGLAPSSLQRFPGADGKVRNSGVWRHPPADDPPWNLYWGSEAIFQARFGELHTVSVLTDLAAYPNGKGIGLAGVWRQDLATSDLLLRGTPAELRRRGAELGARGYRPAAVAVAAPEGGRLDAVAVWHRPRPERVLQAFRQAAEGRKRARAGDIAGAIDLIDPALKVIIAEEGATNLRVANLQWDLAVWCQQRKDYGRAIALLVSARDTYRVVRGTAHADYIDTLLRLGDLHYARSDIDAAVPVYAEVLPLLKAARGADNAAYYTNAAWLGKVYFQRGDYAQAEPLLRDAVPLYEKYLGPKDRTTVSVLQVLGMTLFSAGKYDDAEPVWRALRERQRETLPAGDADQLLTTRVLALIQFRRGQREDSARLFEEARAALKPDADGYLQALEHLERLYTELKDAKHGIPVCRELAERRARDPGKDSPAYARVLADLATFHQQRFEYAEARRSLGEALGVLERGPGEGNSETMSLLSQLCRLEIAAGRLDEAERLAVRFRDRADRHHPGERPYMILARVLRGEVYSACKRYDRAEPLYAEARDLQAAQSGPDSELVAVRLYQLGVLYQTMKRPADSRAALARAAEIQGRRLGATHPDLVETLRALRTACADLWDYEAAEAVDRRLVAIEQKLHTGPNAETAARLMQLGESMVINGRLAAAVDVFRQALEIREAVLAEDDPDRIAGTERLAGMYEVTAALEKALPLRRQLLAVAERNREKQPLVRVRRLAELGELYRRLGRSGEAEPLLVKARDGAADAAGKDSLEYARYLRGLGEFYQNTGRRPEAERCLLEAHAVVKKKAAEDSADFRDSVTALASYYQDLGDAAKAAAYRKLLPPEAKPQDKVREALARRRAEIAAATAALQAGEYVRALPLWQERVRVERAELGENSLTYLTDLWSLAQCYNGLGEPGEAEPLLEKSAELAARYSGPDSPLHALALLLLGDLHASLDEPREAQDCYRRAATIYAAAYGPDSGLTATVYAKAGLLHLRVGETEAARADLARALGDRLRELRATLPGLAEAEALAFLGDEALWAMRDTYLETLRDRPDGAAEAYRMVWQTRALLFQYLADRRQRVNDSPEAAGLYKQLQQVRHELAEATYADTPPEKLAQRKQDLARLNERKEDLEKQLAQVSGAFRRGRAVQTADLDQTLRRLPEGVALVDLVRVSRFRPPPAGRTLFDREDQYEAFVTRRTVGEPGYAVAWVHLGNAEVIDRAIAAWTTDLVAEVTGGRPRREGPLPEQVLRRRVWLPVERVLGGCRTVVVVPEGPLGRLPWAGLPGPTPGSFLLEQYAVATLPYGQRLADLLARPAAPPPAGTMLLAGGIDYDRRSDDVPASGPGRTWPALKGTLAEAQAIARLWQRFGTPDLLQGPGADKRAVLAALPRSRAAHLATHGFFADEDGAGRQPAFGATELAFRGGPTLPGTPAATVAARNPLLLSGLVFAGANRGASQGLGAAEGILTAEEVASADLGGLDLVTLSACETALGRVQREGVFGLQTAFQLAGARTVVASLWKVEDHATQALMVEFYRNVWERKLGKLEALRQAQLKVLHDFDPHTGTLRGVGGKVPAQGTGPAPPFFWAAFTLSGDWR